MLSVITGFVRCTEHDVKSEFLSNDVKLDAVELKSDVIGACYQFIHAKDFFVYQDSILVVINKPHKDGSFVNLFNLNSNELLRSFILLGNGPLEMINVIAHLRNNELIVHDFAKNQILCVNLDSALVSPNYKNVPPLKFSNGVGSPFVTFYNDKKLLIMLNPYYFSNENLRIDNGVSRFIVGDTKINDDLEEIASDLYYTYNVSQGFIIPNIANNRIIYASNFYDELEIYDNELHLLKRIEGPDKLKPVFRRHGKEIIFNKIVPYTYRSYAMSKDFFYLSYIGDNYVPGKNRLQDFDSWIFKFDWNGTLMESYHSNEYISTLSLSDSDDKFYARGFDENGTPVVWQLTK